MKTNKIFILFFFLIVSQNFISSDIISISSTGSRELVLTPGKYVEGFFFGIEEEPVVTPPPPPPPPPPPGPGPPPPVLDLIVDPLVFNIQMQVGTTEKRVVKVTNLGSSQKTVQITHSGLDRMVLIEDTSLTIPPGQTVEFDVIFLTLNEPGVHAGKIMVDNTEILVALNIFRGLILFDSNIAVLNKDYEVRQGDKLKTMVGLIPMGDRSRIDTTLKFNIKDYSNNIYLTKTETLLVEDQVVFQRDFDTGNLPLGQYIVALELVYPGGVATSSAYFKVIEKPKTPFIIKLIVFFIILILLALITFIIIILIKKYKEKKKEQENS